MKNIILFFMVSLVAFSLFAADDKEAPVDVAVQAPTHQALPVYVAELSNINDYALFANTGWDGSWYVGSNLTWIEKLPAPPVGEYRKAFIGAKLGRMKTRPVPGKPAWEKEAIPGNIYVSVASTPAWKGNQKYFIAASKDIPLEGDAENALEGVGESRWFWAEVPLKSVSMTGPTFVALWSPTEYFVSTASSPVLAGGWGSQELNTWMNNDTRGYPPLNPANSLKTGITVFEPAIALKLIPIGTEQEIKVAITHIKDGRKKTSNKTVSVSVSGSEIERVWLEVSTDGKTWQKQGPYVYGAPYVFTLKGDVLPDGKIAVRCAAADIWENTGYSVPAEMVISR